MDIFTEIPLKDLADIGRGAVTKPADIQERTATELTDILQCPIFRIIIFFPLFDV